MSYPRHGRHSLELSAIEKEEKSFSFLLSKTEYTNSLLKEDLKLAQNLRHIDTVLVLDFRTVKSN